MDVFFQTIIAFVPLMILVSAVITLLVDRWSSRRAAHHLTAHHHSLQQDLAQVLHILKAHPKVDEILRDYYFHNFESSRFWQLIQALTGNAIAILLGWLMSALLNPLNIISRLHH